MKIREFEIVASIHIPEYIQYIEARDKEHAIEIFLAGMRDYLTEYIFDNGEEHRDEILKLDSVTYTEWESEVSDDYFWE